MQVNDQNIPIADEKIYDKTYVSTMNYCQTSEATHLCIYDILDKLKYNSKCNDGYSIGGTYAACQPESWFYFTTTCFCDDNYLLNLFFCNRIQKSVSIRLYDCNHLTKLTGMDEPVVTISDCTTREYVFNPIKPNQHHYIKTYCFNKEILEFEAGTSLIIPLKINFDSFNYLVNNDILKSIKLKHNLNGLRQMPETTDFVLQSVTGKQFPVHRVVLLAHSPGLSALVKDSQVSLLFIDIDDDGMELFIEFLYTGTIEDIMQQNCYKLLETAHKFEFDSLLLLLNHVIVSQINVTNAVEIAVVAKKCNWMELQNRAFDFIAMNNQILKTDAWMNLKDLELIRTFYTHTNVNKV